MASSKFHDLTQGSKTLFFAELLILCALFIFGHEFASLFFADIRSVEKIEVSQVIVELLVFIIPIQLAELSVGLYNPKMRENFRGVIRRLVVSVSLAYFGATIIYSVSSSLTETPHQFREWLTLISLLVLIFFRYFSFSLKYDGFGRKRVLVLGAGQRASIIERRMRRKVDRVGFELIGFIRMPGDADDGIKNEQIIDYSGSLAELAIELKVNEIIVACDERRNNLPVDNLFQCKIHGIEITEILDFIERETGQVAVNLIYPSWVIYSNGFQSNNYLRNSLDWIFNAVLATFVLLLTWPIMIFTAIAIWIEEGFKAPILYSQERIGAGGVPFEIFKFRSMSIDAEKDGAQWAQKNDARVTKVGNFIRKYRIDELPQLYNVFIGDMGFVGPRPERGQFVTDLIKKIPYYNERHNVKPGLTGWAQLKYPYGSSENDSLEKLKYDLYYIKHRSFLLDLLILLRTAEIVLFGKGR